MLTKFVLLQLSDLQHVLFDMPEEGQTVPAAFWKLEPKQEAEEDDADGGILEVTEQPRCKGQAIQL